MARYAAGELVIGHKKKAKISIFLFSGQRKIDAWLKIPHSEAKKFLKLMEFQNVEVTNVIQKHTIVFKLTTESTVREWIPATLLYLVSKSKRCEAQALEHDNGTLVTLLRGSKLCPRELIAPTTPDYIRNLLDTLPLSSNNVLLADVTLNKPTAQKLVLGNNNGQNRWASIADTNALPFDTDPGEDSNEVPMFAPIEKTIEDRIKAKYQTKGLRYLFLIDGDQAMGNIKTLLEQPFCDSTLFAEPANSIHLICFLAKRTYENKSTQFLLDRKYSSWIGVVPTQTDGAETADCALAFMAARLDLILRDPSAPSDACPETKFVLVSSDSFVGELAARLKVFGRNCVRLTNKQHLGYWLSQQEPSTFNKYDVERTFFVVKLNQIMAYLASKRTNTREIEEREFNQLIGQPQKFVAEMIKNELIQRRNITFTASTTQSSIDEDKLDSSVFDTISRILNTQQRITLNKLGQELKGLSPKEKLGKLLENSQTLQELDAQLITGRSGQLILQSNNATANECDLCEEFDMIHMKGGFCVDKALRDLSKLLQTRGILSLTVIGQQLPITDEHAKKKLGGWSSLLSHQLVLDDYNLVREEIKGIVYIRKTNDRIRHYRSFDLKFGQDDKPACIAVKEIDQYNMIIYAAFPNSDVVLEYAVRCAGDGIHFAPRPDRAEFYVKPVWVTYRKPEANEDSQEELCVISADSKQQYTVIFKALDREQRWTRVTRFWKLQRSMCQTYCKMSSKHLFVTDPGTHLIHVYTKEGAYQRVVEPGVCPAAFIVEDETRLVMAHEPAEEVKLSSGISWTEYNPDREMDTFIAQVKEEDQKKKEPTLKKPSDIDYFNDHFYVCDKGKSQIVICSREKVGEIKYLLKTLHTARDSE
eukprot:TRINITY_DN7465_c0_g5_i4.p1 TRINITY_DN7465_c0_g5~~TRINITY_DN7465_c0_g5_i4.p1  ORF type:complete len:873 (-),score=167.30 TRINITY_DN7465_c0_g5_i4:305-2923(-)